MNLKDLMPGGLFGGGGSQGGGVGLGGQDSGNRLGGSTTVPAGSPMNGGNRGSGSGLLLGNGAMKSANSGPSGSGAANGGVSALSSAADLPWIARYGVGPTEKHNIAMSGMIPGTNPNAADDTQNERITAGYLFGQNYPNFGPWVGSALTGLKDPNSNFNRFAGAVNPFVDPNATLTAAGVNAIYAGANAAVDTPPWPTAPATDIELPGGSPQGRTFVGPITQQPGGVPDPTSNAPWIDFTSPNTQTGQGGMPSNNGMGAGMGGNAGMDAYPPFTGEPTIPPGNNMPTGPFTFPDLVPDPGGMASNIGTPNAPPPGSVDFGPGTHAGESGGYHPYVAPDPRYDASQSGGAAAGVYDNPILAQAYSNTSGAGTSALQMSEAMSHPSYSQYYQDYLRSHPNG